MKSLTSVARPRVYALVVCAAMLGAGGYVLRREGLFSCAASGYATDRYLAYCQATGYGDYDYGAFWFDLEPAAADAAVNAQVLFLGNSRMQFGISTKATADWFTAHAASYYLFGFAYNGNSPVVTPLLTKLHPRAKVYVINVDLFFEDSLTPPAKVVARDSTARARYVRKRLWQRAHRAICGTIAALCGDEIAFFRSRPSGAWVATGGAMRGGPVTYVQSVNAKMVDEYVEDGSIFLSRLPVRRECIVLTNVPTEERTVGTGAATAKAIAAALGLDLIAPELDHLRTFDGYHLDRQSAERWSSALMEAAGPTILDCLK